MSPGIRNGLWVLMILSALILIMVFGFTILAGLPLPDAGQAIVAVAAVLLVGSGGLLWWGARHRSPA